MSYVHFELIVAVVAIVLVLPLPYAFLVLAIGGVTKTLSHYWLNLSWLEVIAITVAGSVLFDRLAGHATRGRATRPVRPPPANPSEPGRARQPIPDAPPDARAPYHERWYIESTGAGGAPIHSCSFIEFDERGDYLDFWQHEHALQKTQALANDATPFTLVVFVHGWRHSGQSDNVVSFNAFLGRLAKRTGRRVHGVYLAWRGGAFRPSLSGRDLSDEVRAAHADRDLIDTGSAARIPLLNDLLETLSYFDRKRIPEHMFSGTALSRSIFSCAAAAKHCKPDCEVLLAGHSFGGLMLERTFQNAAIGELVQSWSWGKPVADHPPRPLPFDTVMLVNSAAPSIYAKQFQGFLAAHTQAMAAAHVTSARVPLMFSVTSSADWATHYAHAFANALSRILPTLRRSYDGDDYILQKPSHAPGAAAVPSPAGVEVPESYYYRHTPGHNPLLVNRFVEPLPGSATTPPAMRFAAADGTWHITFPPADPAFDAFSFYRKTYRPLAWTITGAGHHGFADSVYWIIRCPKAIIKGHNDIWSDRAMEMYFAFHRIAGLPSLTPMADEADRTRG